MEYPRLRLALSKRVATYNRQLQIVEDLEREGRVEVIRPQRPMDVGRMERNITRLEKLYEEGFALGEEYALKK